ncbi:MAG TPA: outer membrane beta-barrel protein [Bacteroidota bacterium]|nr:outer membrane beta-barrel protein [Bacteroidota bacterium]
MKGYRLLPLLVAVIPSVASAQFVRGWGIDGGVSGAYQLLTITQPGTSPAVPRAARTGFSAGVFVELLNVPNLSFVAEAAYTQKGRKVTAEEIAAASAEPGYLSPGPAGATPRLDYVRLAMMVKVRAWRYGFVPYAALGPRFDFLVGKVDDPSGLFRSVRRTDVGVALAAGIEIVPHRNPIVSLEARWSPAFTRLLSPPTLTIRNQTLEALFALWL